MKRLYTYSDFVHNIIKESQDINSNMEVFTLNEMQKEWTLEETKSMYEIKKDNIYQNLKDKFEQRIDIILTGEEDLFSVSKPGGTGSYYQKKMSETLYNNKTFGDYSKIIKDDWSSKVFSRLQSLPSSLQVAYEDIAKLGKIKFDERLNIKNSYDIVQRAYGKDASGNTLEETLFIYTNLTEPALKLIRTYLFIYHGSDPNFYKVNTDPKFYKVNTDNIFSETGIDNNKYVDDFKAIKKEDSDGKISFPFKDFHKTIKREFYEYYRHYHFWLFANLIMNGKPNTVSSSTSTKRKSSTSTVTTPTRERRTVDRASVGQTISDL